jgi:hypothetical protein
MEESSVPTGTELKWETVALRARQEWRRKQVATVHCSWL